MSEFQQLPTLPWIEGPVSPCMGLTMMISPVDWHAELPWDRAVCLSGNLGLVLPSRAEFRALHEWSREHSVTRLFNHNVCYLSRTEISSFVWAYRIGSNVRESSHHHPKHEAGRLRFLSYKVA